MSIVALFLTVLAGIASAAELTEPAGGEPPNMARLIAGLQVDRDVVFKQVDDRKLDLLFFHPVVKRFEKAPLVVYIHGGGWGGGDKYKVLRADLLNVVRDLNQQGIACASIEYRLTDRKTATAYECAIDCKDSIRFFVKNADRFGIDPDRIGTFGSSAGGHLTLVTALCEDADFPGDPSLAGPAPRIRCVAAYYPLVSFLVPELKKGGNFERPERMIPMLGGRLEDKRPLAGMLSPLSHLKAGSPAIFLAHGDNDKVLSYLNTVALRAAAEAKQVPVEAIIVKGAGHGFSGESIEPGIPEINRRTVEFFVKYLAK